MTFAPGTKVRYKAHIEPLTSLNGIEGVVTETRPYSTTMIRVTKGTDRGTHNDLVGTEHGFSSSAFIVVEDAPREFEVGDRVKVNDAGNTTHHGLVGTITDIDGFYFGTVKADVDESCEAYKALKEWNKDLDGKDWFLKAETLELVVVEEEKLEEGAEISYEQVERGQRIRVSYEAKGVTHSREGIVGKVSKNLSTYSDKQNWTINALDEQADMWGDKGQRLNWGSDKVRETIVLLENVPEVDAVLERLLESKGGTVIRAFHNPEFLVREPFSDGWKNTANQRVYTSEFVRHNAGDKIVFFVEDMEGN